MLRKAAVLLQSAGVVLKDGKRVTPKGERVTVEFLVDEPSFQPHHLPFIKNLATLASMRLCASSIRCSIAPAFDAFDFDIAIERFQFSSTPGDSMRPFFDIAGGGSPRARRIWPASPIRPSMR